MRIAVGTMRWAVLRERLASLRRQRVAAHALPLGIALGCAAIGQVITLMQSPAAVNWPDSTTYLAAAHHMLASHVIFDPMRTPAYPGLLALIFALFGDGNLRAVVTAQAGLTILAVPQIYLLAWWLGGRRWLASLIGSLVGLNLYIASWERTILTETLAYFLVVTVCVTFTWYLRTERRGALVALAIAAVLLFFTRPNYAYLPAVLFGFLFVWSVRRHRLGATWRQLAVALAAVYALLVAYVIGNGLTNGYYGVTYLTNVNLLGKIMEYRLQNDWSDPRYTHIAADVNAYLARTPRWFESPKAFLDLHPAYSAHFDAFAGQYALDIIRHHPAEYAQDTYNDLFVFWRATPDFFYTDHTPSTRRAAWWIAADVQISDAEQAVFPLLSPAVLVLALLVLAIWVWRYPAHWQSFALLTLLIVLAAEITLSASLIWNEYTRVRFPEDWIMLLASVLLTAEALAAPARRGQRLFATSATASARSPTERGSRPGSPGSR